MIVHEYRIVLPMTLEEFRIAQLYTTMETSKDETAGGEGVEVVKNEPFEGKVPLGVFYAANDRAMDTVKGQYTYKIFHLKTKVPSFIRLLAPKGSLEVQEEAWNYFPETYTKLSNPYMKDSFWHSVETKILADDDGTRDNVFNLDSEQLEHRIIQDIDIVTDPVDRRDYKEAEDPAKYSSLKTGRGPLAADWKTSASPKICVYKLIATNFEWFGLQNKVEKIIMKSVRRLILNFHRKLFCLTDQWFGMSIADIRELEKEAKSDLDKQRQTGQAKGMFEK